MFPNRPVNKSQSASSLTLTPLFYKDVHLTLTRPALSSTGLNMTYSDHDLFIGLIPIALISFVEVETVVIQVSFIEVKFIVIYVPLIQKEIIVV